MMGRLTTYSGNKWERATLRVKNQDLIDKLAKYEDMDEEAKEHKFLIDIPADGNCIYILGHRIPGFDSFEDFCEYLLNFQRLEKELQKYKDLEEQGLLMKLPYNIGTCGVIYYVDERDLEIYRLQADRIEISKTMISNKFTYTIDSYEFYFEDFGKIVFTSKQEAEAKLKELENE